MPSALTLLTILVTAVAALAAYGYARAGRPMVVAALACAIGLAWGGWGMAMGWRPLARDTDPRIALRSSEWRCADSHMTQSTALVPMGKALMPVTTTQRVCDRYERR